MTRNRSQSCKDRGKSIASQRGTASARALTWAEHGCFLGRGEDHGAWAVCKLRSGQAYAGLDHVRFRPPSPGKGRNFAPSMMKSLEGLRKMTLSRVCMCFVLRKFFVQNIFEGTKNGSREPN